MKTKNFFILILIGGLFSGCAKNVGNVGHVQSYPFPVGEAAWIRNGEPIEFEGEKWFPCDGMESLLDAEVYPLGEYRGVPFFVEKLDVRPYNRLYTKFGKNMFRYFEQKKRAKKDEKV